MAEYIEREAIEYPYMTMNLWGLNQSTCHAYNEGVKAAADAIAAMPAADVVEVKRGRWEFGELDIMGTTVKCSCCGWSLKSVDPVLWIAYPAHKFCGSCGADMREVNDAN